MKRFDFKLRDIDPLFQFLGIGLLLFVAAGLAGPIQGDDKTIDITRAELETYLSSGGGETLAAVARNGEGPPTLDRLSEEQRRALVSAYAEEQALYREARDWGLDDGDLVIRRRLGQSLQFAIRPEPAADPGDAVLRRFYENRIESYRNPTETSFDHIYFGADKRDWKGAFDAANKVGGGNIDDWRGSGDRYAFQRSFANTGPGMVESHLGDGFRKAIDALKVDPSRWQGPIRSTRGYHLVRLSARQIANTADFATVRPAIFDDWQRAQQAAELDRAVDAIVQQYDTNVAPDIFAKGGA